MMKFRRSFRLALLLAFGVALANCGSDTNNNASFRVIQASPDLPLVNLLVDGVVLRSGVDYRGGPGFLTVTPQTYEFGVEAPVFGSDGLVTNVPLLNPPVQKALAAGSEYSVIAIGKAATGTVHPLVIENVTEDVPPGSARLQFVHAAPDIPAVVDIYLTAVPALPDLLPDLSTQTPIDQVTYDQLPAARKVVPAGSYVIRVTPAGLKEPVLFDSGETSFDNGNIVLLPLNNGVDLLLVVVDNTAAGSSPLSLAVNSGFRAFFNPAGTFNIFDKDSPSELRVVQVSPNAPVLNVVGTRPQEPPIPPATELPPLRTVTFATGLSYLDDTGYVPTIPDFYTVRGVPTSTPDTTTPLFTVTPNLLIGQRTTLFTNGLVAGSPLVLPGDIRPVFAQGKLRVVDASNYSGAVDIYILASTPVTDIATVLPTYSNIGLNFATPYLPLFPRNYTVTFTTTGTKTVLATQEVGATEGTVQTLVLRDAAQLNGDGTPNGSDGKPPAVLLLDDRAT